MTIKICIKELINNNTTDNRIINVVFWRVYKQLSHPCVYYYRLVPHYVSTIAHCFSLHCHCRNQLKLVFFYGSEFLTETPCYSSLPPTFSGSVAQLIWHVICTDCDWNALFHCISFLIMAAIMPDSDSEDELPPGWEERAAVDGSVYYVK
jgi:hypothetical protein